MAAARNTSEHAAHGAEQGTSSARSRMADIILDVLSGAGRPMSAYDILTDLKRQHDGRLAPPTVYRALDLLVEQGRASKVESRRAYVPCAHPGHDHSCVILLCNECGRTEEIDVPLVQSLLAEKAAGSGFTALKTIIEIEGVCAGCASPENG